MRWDNSLYSLTISEGGIWWRIITVARSGWSSIVEAVPSQSPWLEAVIGSIKGCIEDLWMTKIRELEASVENMGVPL